MEVVLDGPSKNALGTSLLTWLLEQIEAAGDEPILLTGAGDVFSAGLDLKEVLALKYEAMSTFLSLLQEVTHRLFQHPAPTVACVNGHAIAGGAVLARACDYAVVTDQPKAKIGLNEVAIGLQFPPRLLEIMSSRIPPRYQHEVLLGATLFSPPEAFRVGLVDEVSSTPMEVAQGMLERLGQHPRAAYAATKQQLHGAVGAPDPDQDRRFLEQVVPTWTSDELKARIGALLGPKK